MVDQSENDAKFVLNSHFAFGFVHVLILMMWYCGFVHVLILMMWYCGFVHVLILMMWYCGQ